MNAFEIADFTLRLLTTTVTAVGIILAFLSWRQKLRADNRADWWHRITWALNETHSDQLVKRRLSSAMILHLVESPLLMKEDHAIAASVAAHMLPVYFDEPGSDRPEDDNGETENNQRKELDD